MADPRPGYSSLEGSAQTIALRQFIGYVKPTNAFAIQKVIAGGYRGVSTKGDGCV
jgi:hypothetical protein